MRKSFIFYQSFYEGIKEVDLETQTQIYSAIFKYQFEDEEVELTGVAKALFNLIKPQLDANNTKYENGKKGGAPIGNSNAKKQPKNNLKTTKKQPKNNLNQPNENENVNENENENVNEDIITPIIPHKKKYGEYGRVILTEKQYEKLCNEYNKDFIDTKIKQLDEYIQSNNNKNKYKDFNLVLRKAIRESWFINQKKQLTEWFNKKNEKQKLTDAEQKEMEELMKEFKGD